MAKVTYKSIPFSVKSIAELSPLTAAIFNNDPELLEVFNHQFHYPTTHADSMPFYEFRESEVRQICEASEAVYGALVDSLELLFTKYEHLIGRFYGEAFIDKFPQFVDYAKFTYFENHEAIGGRFDIAYDFENECVRGVYEFNGDTPVMLFESVAVQDWMVNQIGRQNDQCNHWFENLIENINKIVPHYEHSRVGFFANMKAIEDALTTEQLRWTFGGHSECHLHDLSELEYDFTYGDKPFHVRGKQFDFLFMLLPWEEMIENSPEIIFEWQKWGQTVKFFEPAWRWFVSNKGSMAWLHWLMTSGEEPEFTEQYGWALNFLLPTTLEPLHECETFVEKPMLGRLSSNIRIIHQGEVTYETGGYYGNTPMVYQAYCEPGRIPGRSSAIVGVWMAPFAGEPLMMEASTVCIREFDDQVNDIGNERFIPHLVD